MAGPVGLATAAETAAATVVEVGVTGGLLTVDARNAPLAHLLRTIGEKAGFEVTIHGDLGVHVTRSFAGVPLEEGIRRLADGYSVAVTYHSVGEPPQEVLARVWVAGSGASSGRAAAQGAPEPASKKVDQHAGPAGQSTPSPPKPGPADEGTAQATDQSAVAAARTREIAALADEADRDSAAAVARLVDIGASDASATVRHQAVAALGRLATSAVEPALVAALADGDVSVRARAVRGLRQFGTDGAVNSIARVLAADADPQVRLVAVAALTSLPGSGMMRGLAKAAVSDPDSFVRDAAIRGLAWWQARLSVGR